MNSILIFVSVSLILAILFLIFRIGILTNVLKGKSDQQVGSANTINAFLFVVVFVLGIIGFYLSFVHSSKYFLGEPASQHGVETDRLFWIIMSVLTLAFLVTNTMLYIFPFVYRYKEGKRALFYPDNHFIERIWTIIPAIVMTGFVYFGWLVWSDIMKPASDKAEVIEVMAKQFAWQVRYPGVSDNKLGAYHFRKIDATNEFGIDFNDEKSFDDFLPTELYLPKGKEVLLEIRARDVIHSVFLPHFRVKMDAVPGMPTKFRFVPTITTKEMRVKNGNPNFNYELVCTEICGRGHYAMRFPVVVVEQAEYDEWKKKQTPWAQLNAEYVAQKTTKELKEKYLKLNGLPVVAQPEMDSVKVDSTSNNLQALSVK
ncbi:MAG: cytochrome c oxidase subunit II [Cytophagaceae bacterium]|jgi:cytochrome c oxidase subunit 2|nr:cytochrome c oxidase subunit II [Cytophagaceae bacterium]